MMTEAELLKQHIYNTCSEMVDGCSGCPYDFFIKDRCGSVMHCACYLILMSIGAYEKC